MLRPPSLLPAPSYLFRLRSPWCRGSPVSRRKYRPCAIRQPQESRLIPPPRTGSDRFQKLQCFCPPCVHPFWRISTVVSVRTLEKASRFTVPRKTMHGGGHKLRTTGVRVRFITPGGSDLT